MTKKNSLEEEKIIEDFVRSRERAEKFIREELESRKSPIRKRIKNIEVVA